MSLVKGEDVIVYIYDSAWKPLVCGRSSSRDLVTEYIKTSVSGSGINETIVPTENSETLEVEGLVNLEEPGTFSKADLDAVQESHQRLLIRRETTDQSGNVYTREAHYYITRSTDTGSFDGMNTFSAEFRRTGPTLLVYTPTTPLNNNKVKRYPANGDSLNMVGGELYFESVLLLNKDVIEVVKDGLGHAKIILTGTPVGKEALYTPSIGGKGRITFGIDFQAGEEGYVLYQDI